MTVPSDPTPPTDAPPTEEKTLVAPQSSSEPGRLKGILASAVVAAKDPQFRQDAVAKGKRAGGYCATSAASAGRGAAQKAQAVAQHQRTQDLLAQLQIWAEQLAQFIKDQRVRLEQRYIQQRRQEATGDPAKVVARYDQGNAAPAQQDNPMV